MSVRAKLIMAAVAAMLAGTSVCAAAPGVGGEIYRARCSSCHGAELGGAAGPMLVGENFFRRWKQHPKALRALIARTMPYDAPGSLSKSDYAAVTQYIMAQNAIGQPGIRVAPAASQAFARFPGSPKSYGPASTTGPGDRELSNSPNADWLLYNRDYAGQRHSPLDQITPANASSLAPKCLFQTGEIGSFEASPIVREGLLYVTTAHNTYAIDAATCHQIWKYTYEPVSAEPLPTNRGIALYRGMAVRGTLDGHLIALDAANGRLLWDEAVADSRKGYFISAAPMAFDGKIFVGEAGADFGAAGHVHAFDATSGRPLWTFNGVPAGNEPGAESWGKGETPGGSSTWTTITLEPATHSLYVPLGNPGLDFDGPARPGANLYSDSVVVLDTGTGKLKWFVQQNPHDVHDWDTAAAPVIYDEDGRKFMAVGSKDARLYIYDRDSHALIARKDLTRRSNDLVPLSSQKGVHVCPGFLGGVEWNGPAYDPVSRLIFVNTVDWCATFKQAGNATENPQGGVGTDDPTSDARGWLRAFDAATGNERWSYEAGTPMLAGITTTASGLILTGTGAGDFLVFDAKTGRKLYSFYTGGSVAGGPSTYLAGARQFVAVASGNNSKSMWQVSGAATVVVFGLP